jgi:hypothetical protein
LLPGPKRTGAFDALPGMGFLAIYLPFLVGFLADAGVALSGGLVRGALTGLTGARLRTAI